MPYGADVPAISVAIRGVPTAINTSVREALNGRTTMVGRVKPLLLLLRPLNCLMMALAVIVAAFIASGGVPAGEGSRLLLACVSAFALTGAAMVTNDIFDLPTDSINRPSRPLPSGAVSVREAWLYAFTLSALGLTCSAALGWAPLALAATALAVSLAYNAGGKKSGLAGNLMVSFNVALPFIYGPVVVGKLTTTVLVFWLMVFLANTGRELIKGVADVAGDARTGVRTVAVSKGPEAACKLGASFVLAAVALSAVPAITNALKQAYAPVVALADAGFLYTSFRVVTRPSPDEALRQKGLMLYWMLLGLIAFIAGSL